ncbi:MAG: hypothetical protein RL223_966 [Pseudomonadota bacterium]|jgi:hypothetical protein
MSHPAPDDRPPPSARFVRLDETDRPPVALMIDGRPAQALAGDTLLTALLQHGRRVRDSEFGCGPRAGFCLMGACQDCWVWTPQGGRLRACSTPVSAGLQVLTAPPAHHWPVTPDLAASAARVGEALPRRAPAGADSCATPGADAPTDTSCPATGDPA